ncbi:MAG: M16 family metallopeptidase [Alphaproteobacteria bacterium]
MRARLFPLLLILLAAATAPAAAVTIQTVRSPGGIEAWLVEDRTQPILSIALSFRGGATQDPVGREGASDVMADLMTEGAGDFDGDAFRARLEEIATTVSFAAGRDTIDARFRTLSRYRAEALAMLRLALTAPRFDQSALDRTRAQHLASIARSETAPGSIAQRTWWRIAFPSHVYGRRGSGTAESIRAVTTDDVRAAWRDQIALDTLRIGVVGDIDAATLAQLLDGLFEGLPATARLAPTPPVSADGMGEVVIVEQDQGQSVVTFGAPGIKRDDPDFEAAHLVNHILGGGGFSARLMQAVRERAGLAYSVSTGLATLDATGVLQGSVATTNAAVARSIELIRAEFARMAAEGPTAQELADAKAAVIGSFALSLDSTSRIAGFLVALQRDKLGTDYIQRRPERFGRVTLDDARRVAARLFDPAKLSFVIVGKPRDLTATRSAPSPG